MIKTVTIMGSHGKTHHKLSRRYSVDTEVVEFLQIAIEDNIKKNAVMGNKNGYTNLRIFYGGELLTTIYAADSISTAYEYISSHETRLIHGESKS